MRPLVSVLIPTYNRPDYLRYALESAIKQSYKNVEILIGDNSSSSLEAAEIVKSLNDSRIKYVYHSQNLGMVGNNIFLIKESAGDYIAILHDDDIWYPDFLEKNISVLETESQINMAFSNFDVIDNEGKRNDAVTDIELKRLNRDELKQGIQSNGIELALVRRSIFACMATVIKRSSIQMDDLLVKTDSAYDIWLSYLALSNNSKVYFLSESLGGYRMHTSSNTATRFLNSNLSLAYCYKNLLKDDRLSKYFNYFRMEVAAHSIRSLILIFQKGSFDSLKQLGGGFFPLSVLQIFFASMLSFLPKSILQSQKKDGSIWNFAWKIRNYWQHRLRQLKLNLQRRKTDVKNQPDVLTPRWLQEE